MNNKKCKFEYELLDSYIAGIQLNGPEVKAIRDNKISFNDSFCSIENNEIYLNKFHISIKDGGENDFLRKRKLLLNKKEIIKIGKDIKEKGLTVVPSSIFLQKMDWLN